MLTVLQSLTFSLLLIGAFCFPAQATAPAVEGSWIGAFELGGNTLAFAAGISRNGENLRSAFYLVSMGGIKEIPSSTFTLRNDRVHFELSKDGEKLAFDGQLTGDRILGEVQAAAGPRTAFHLMRFTALDVPVLARYAGEYEVEPGHFIWIGQAGNALRYEDLKSGRFGLLVASSSDTFFGGPSQLTFYPNDVTVTFFAKPQGEVTHLVWKDSASSPRTARRVHLYREEPVVFQNGSVSLSGTLRIPTSKGEHTAVVFLHGSDAADRNAFTSLPAFFALNGIATLAYDKRGVGASTGQYFNANFTDLADDAVAAVHLLKSRADINPRQIGFWGLSQGALYIAPLAAARSRDVSFIISISGASMTPADQKIFTDEAKLRAAGYSASAVEQVALLHQQLNDYYRTGRNRAELEIALSKAQRTKWYQLTLLPKELALELPPPEAIERTWWRQNMDYDPAETLAKLNIPILALFGGKDELVPVTESAARFDQATKKAGNKNASIKIFPKGNHYGLGESETGSADEYPRLKRYVPGYLDLMLSWALARSRE